MLFLFNTISELDLYKALVVIGPILSVGLTLIVTRKKTTSEVDTNYNKIISDLRKENNELSDKLAEVRLTRDDRIAAIRAECDIKLQNLNAKNLEIYEKLEGWIIKVEKYAEDGIKSDDNLANIEAQLKNCLETKDKHCKTCINQALDILHKVEMSLLGSIEHNELLQEIWQIKQELQENSL